MFTACWNQAGLQPENLWIIQMFTVSKVLSGNKTGRRHVLPTIQSAAVSICALNTTCQAGLSLGQKQ